MNLQNSRSLPLINLAVHSNGNTTLL